MRSWKLSMSLTFFVDKESLITIYAKIQSFVDYLIAFLSAMLVIQSRSDRWFAFDFNQMTQKIYFTIYFKRHST